MQAVMRPFGGFSSARVTRSSPIVPISPGLSLLVASMVAFAAGAAETPQSARSRLATFDTSAGETYFALSLMADAEQDAERAADVVVMFDTSASQTGLYREGGIDALKTMLASMENGTRVRLLAVDVNAVPLNDAFDLPDGAEVKQAMEKLNGRTPLGATDMNAALRAALPLFADCDGKLRTIVYIGDGISRANILEDEEFRGIIAELVKERVSVSSFAIGPERDVQLLAALANHTGGMVYLDSNESNLAQQAGIALARAARGTVLWPTSVKLPETMREVYPAKMPPFRVDRDSILIGLLDERGPQQISISAEVLGKQIELRWEFTAEPSSEELGFLPQLVAQARENDGMTLPTVGSAGLREVGRVILASAEDLVEIGMRALKTGDYRGAEKVADTVLRRDPSNPQALAIKRAAQKKTDAKPGDTGLILKQRQPSSESGESSKGP